MSNTAETLSKPVFVGDHLALDFVNTNGSQGQEPIELLSDGSELLEWLVASSAVEPSVAQNFRKTANSEILDEVAKLARSLRAWTRGFLERHAGEPFPVNALDEFAPLNDLLAQADSHLQIRRNPESETLELCRHRRWTSPAQLLHPLAEAVGELIAKEDFSRIRICQGPGCSMLFLDRTKSRARRWCSMAACGNRAKVAAHRARKKRRSRQPVG